MRSVKHKNDNSACLCFLVMSPDPYFSSLWFPEHNSEKSGRIKEQVSAECHTQD